jgi:glycerate dehydrogenase
MIRRKKEVSMNIVILDSETLGKDLDLSPLLQFGELLNFPTTSQEETVERIQDADIVITNKVVITKEMMQKANNLKLICIAATGMNNIDLKSAEELEITVKNVTGYSTPSVVQHTFAMALHLIEKIDYYQQTVKSKAWSQSGLFTDVSQPFHEISGKTWGVIGLGTIGKEVAKVAEAFGASINYYSTSGQNKINDYHHVPLNELLHTSDIISIHAPLNEQTLNLINAENLPLLKEKSILLNLGRGGIINEEDLAEELNKREIYVALDVCKVEPIPQNHPLLSLQHPDRLLITPHIAWASIEARVRLLDGIIKNIESFIGPKFI